MNTPSKKLLTLAAIAVSFMSAGMVKAEADAQDGSFYYSNRAYVQAIPGAPNPVMDNRIDSAKMVYVNQAYGQAIYSYPANVAFQEMGFNAQYVDTAYGQAIYSYPSNNPVKPYLELQ